MYIHIPIQYLRHQVVWICFGLAFFRVVPFRTLHASVSRSVVGPALPSILSHQALPQTAYVPDETSNISLPNPGLPVQVIGSLADRVEKTERQRMQETVAAHTVDGDGGSRRRLADRRDGPEKTYRSEGT